MLRPPLTPEQLTVSYNVLSPWSLAIANVSAAELWLLHMDVCLNTVMHIYEFNELYLVLSLPIFKKYHQWNKNTSHLAQGADLN